MKLLVTLQSADGTSTIDSREVMGYVMRIGCTLPDENTHQLFVRNSHSNVRNRKYLVLPSLIMTTITTTAATTTTTTTFPKHPPL